MEIYKDINNDSGIYGFEINTTCITIWFHGANRSYTYSYQSAGENRVEDMKRLAQEGDGLNSYIMRYAKKLYE